MIDEWTWRLDKRDEKMKLRAAAAEAAAKDVKHS